MAALKSLQPEISSHLKGAPTTTVVSYIRRAARQLARDSGIWEKNLGSVEVNSSTEILELDVPSVDPSIDENWEADFELPTDSALLRISKVMLGDDEASSSYYNYDQVQGKLLVSPNLLKETQTLAVYGILIPSIDAATIPDFLVNSGSEAIVAYAIWEMMRMPDQVWSSAGQAWMFKKQYDNRLSEMTVDNARGFTEQSITLPPTPFTG